MCCRYLLLAALVSTSASAQRRPVEIFPQNKEAELGAKLAAGVQKNVTPVESAALSEYVNRIGSKLAAVLPDEGIRYEFTVVRNSLGGSTHEPLALPGGPIFIPADLVLTARTEAEFAGMLAHAIAHVLARHGTRLATRAQSDGIAFSPTMYSNLGWREDSDVHLRELERGFELEADVLALFAIAKAEYNPEAFADYIAREQKDDEGTWSPLPPRDERVAKMRAAIPGSLKNEYQHLQDELRKLLAAPK